MGHKQQRILMDQMLPVTQPTVKRAQSTDPTSQNHTVTQSFLKQLVSMGLDVAP